MIAIVDYGVGNVGSIANMIKKAGGRSEVTADPARLAAADGLILPGVGAFDHGMRKLRERGLVDVLNEHALDRRVPTLGICLGMQLLGQGSEEGKEAGLGWIDGGAVRFDPARSREGAGELKVPHMGWNHVAFQPAVGDPLLDDRPRFYFVHSYHMVLRDPGQRWGTTRYGYEFCSAVRAGNILGVQFHPEKSHRFGLALLRSFLRLCS